MPHVDCVRLPDAQQHPDGVRRGRHPRAQGQDGQVLQGGEREMRQYSCVCHVSRFHNVLGYVECSRKPQRGDFGGRDEKTQSWSN